MNDFKRKDLLIVVGGPGSSGSSTLSKMLSEYFNIQRVYAGSIFRERVKDLGFSTLDEFYQKADKELFYKIDKEVDQRLIETAKKGNVLIESKVFAGLATVNNIPCTVRIWLDAKLSVRVKRFMGKQKDLRGIPKGIIFLKTVFSLIRRRIIDGRRYKFLYKVDYSNEELYNDIVLDTSKLNEKQTFDLILRRISDGGYINHK